MGRSRNSGKLPLQDKASIRRRKRMSRSASGVFAVIYLSLCVCAGCSWLGGPSDSYERQVAEGRELYEANGCALCHGALGHGDGPVAKTIHNYPTDFRYPCSFVNGYSVGQIAYTIGTGLTQGDRSMPPYDHLTAKERELLAVFVMSLRASPPKEEKNNEQP